MARPRKGTRKRGPQNDTHRLFLERVKQEMGRQKLSQNALSKRHGAPAQKTINDAMNGADISLDTVHRIALGLGVPVWFLFAYPSSGEKEGNPYNVTPLPPAPKIFPDTDQDVGIKTRKPQAK